MMTRRRIGMALVAMAMGLWLAASACAGQRQQASADQTFAKQAMGDGLAEVQLGKLAVERAASPDVKQFGQRMVDDHGKANRELMALAKRKGIKVPTAPDRKHRQTAARLATLHGVAFDRAYIQQMVQDHAADVKRFRTQAQEGTDPELKRFAAATLSTLETHLDMARSLAKPTW
jgi:putative membrane protein